MAVSTDRRGIDRKRWKATRRAVLERDQYRCRKDEFAAGRSSTTAQLRKTNSACGQQCTPRMVPAMCPDSVPVLYRCPDRRLNMRWPAAASRNGAHATTDQGAQRTADGSLHQRQHPAGDAERPPIPHSVTGERQRHCRPGRFLFTQGAFRRRRRRQRPGRITVVIGNAPALVPRAVAPAQTPFPITCDYTE